MKMKHFCLLLQRGQPFCWYSQAEVNLAVIYRMSLQKDAGQMRFLGDPRSFKMKSLLYSIGP